MPTIPPSSGQNPNPISPQEPIPTKAPSSMEASSQGGFSNMTEFMNLFTPEERKKFMNILVQNISRDLERASKRYIEELKRQRQEMDRGD